VVLPAVKTVKLTVMDADNKAVFSQDMPVGAHGTVAADLTLASDAGLGYYSIGVTSNGNEVNQGSFYVEEYKKPEYQVKVTPSAQRVLQGNKIQAVIDARYFFGEPVANAKVKYVVHTSQHYWWNEEDTDDGAKTPIRQSRVRTTRTMPGTRPSSGNRKACWTPMAS
jgi:uncharacterized protein YfaS (alpha-2-macroglobulin family)